MQYIFHLNDSYALIPHFFNIYLSIYYSHLCIRILSICLLTNKEKSLCYSLIHRPINGFYISFERCAYTYSYLCLEKGMQVCITTCAIILIPI